MPKSIIAILLIACSSRCFAFSDSTGKEEQLLAAERTTANFETAFRQKIVSAALDEYQSWRNERTMRESDPPAFEIMKKYWAEFNWHPTDRQLADSLWQEQHPWSAVFVSWILKQAGAGNSFKYAVRHSEYIVWAKKNQLKKKEKAFFVAYDICDKHAAWPEPGDLLCKNRDGKNLTLNSITANDISHADIVIEVDRETGTITTIGGNLRNTVSKRTIRLDAEGFIDRGASWVIEDEEAGNPTGNQNEFFSIIKIRMPDTSFKLAAR